MPKKHTYEYVKNYIEQTERELRSKEYKNNRTKLEIRCPEEHIFWMSFGDFQQGHRCPECAKKKHGQYRKFRYQYVKEYIEEQGELLLSEKYNSIHNKLEIQCSKGHNYLMSFDSFKQGHRCPECSGRRRLTNQEIKESLQLYDNIRENSNGEIEVTCRYCGEWFVPKRYFLTQRIRYINGEVNNEYNMYCSQQCKDNCPIFNRNYYPKGYAPATSREVQPQLRQLVFKRDSYTCQKCGWHKDDLNVGLHCHHKFPLNEDPIQSADIDTCITLCETCHKWVHQNVPGCGYGEVRC